jgi:hypothetical protein
MADNSDAAYLGNLNNHAAASQQYPIVPLPPATDMILRFAQSVTDLAKPFLMKPFLYLVFCFLFVAGRASGQSDNSKNGHVQFTFVAGVQASNMKFGEDDVGRYKFAVGEKTPWELSFTTAIWVDIADPTKGQRVHFKTGLTFYNNKFCYQEDFVAGNLRYDFNVESVRLEVPLLIKIPLQASSGGFYLQGGTGINFHVKFEDNLSVYTLSSSTLSSEYTELQPNPLALNILFGGGYEFELGTQSLVADFLYGINPMLFKSGQGAPGTVQNSATIVVGLKL